MANKEPKLLVSRHPLRTLKLHGATLNVYLALNYHANKQGECWPSIERLSELTGYTKRQCQRGIAELIKIGAIQSVARARKDGSKSTNLYRLAE